MEKEFEKILGLFKTDKIVTQKDIDAVLSGVLQLLTQFKSDTSSINEDTKKQVEKLLSTVLDKYQSQNADINQAKSEFNDLKTSIKSKFEKSVEEIQYLISEFKKIKPEDGVSPDINEIVSLVLEQLNSQEDPEDDTEEMDGCDIIDKINELDYSEENQIDWQRIKNVPDFMESLRSDTSGFERRNVTVISNAVDLDTTARADGYAIVWDATNKRHKYSASGGGGGSMAIDESITSATQGSILFAGASGVLAQDNSKLFWNDTNNILGVGTASPLTQTGNRLQVGDNSASNQYLVFQTSNGHDRGIHYYLSDGTSLRGYMKWDLNEDLLLKGDVTFISTQNLTNPFTFTDSGGAGIGLMGIGTTSPTHSLTLNSTATGIALYNTSDQTTNYERVQMYWTGNVYTIQTQKGGSGSNRNLTIGTVSRVLQFLESPTGTQGFYTFSNSTGGSLNALSITTTRSNSASVAAELTIQPTYNQSSTAGYTCLLINPTESTTGSGAKNLADFQVAGVSKFTVSNTGLITSSSNTINLSAASITRSGAHNLTLSTSGATNVTFPTTGTLATLAGAETLSSKTLTAPVIVDTGYIADGNGNEYLKFSQTVSATNEITIKNNSNGNAPEIQSTGSSDSNIDLKLVPKGTGIVKGTLHRFMVRLVASDTDVATGTTIGGDYRIANRAITVKAVGAYNDTAGTTGTMTIDFNEAGTTIMTTNKVNIDSTQKTSTTAGTQPAVTDTTIAADAIVTFDVDAVHTTKAKGLVVWVDYVYA